MTEEKKVQMVAGINVVDTPNGTVSGQAMVLAAFKVQTAKDHADDLIGNGGKAIKEWMVIQAKACWEAEDTKENQIAGTVGKQAALRFTKRMSEAESYWTTANADRKKDLTDNGCSWTEDKDKKISLPKNTWVQPKSDINKAMSDFDISPMENKTHGAMRHAAKDKRDESKRRDIEKARANKSSDHKTESAAAKLELAELSTLIKTLGLMAEGKNPMQPDKSWEEGKDMPIAGPFGKRNGKAISKTPAQALEYYSKELAKINAKVNEALAVVLPVEPVATPVQKEAA